MFQDNYWWEWWAGFVAGWLCVPRFLFRRARCSAWWFVSGLDLEFLWKQKLRITRRHDRVSTSLTEGFPWVLPRRLLHLYSNYPPVSAWGERSDVGRTTEQKLISFFKKTLVCWSLKWLGMRERMSKKHCLPCLAWKSIMGCAVWDS